ncbi:hypothetical protein [Halococcoides cellulosivorans]|uniref:hypothetical protein n=1 Tax=Halococcoides cellulosivorans TaxID=1679096 RepID=UPI00131EE44D|nr:hypothetical protein [Halococcoides cellulosivorans]
MTVRDDRSGQEREAVPDDRSDDGDPIWWRDADGDIVDDAGTDSGAGAGTDTGGDDERLWTADTEAREDRSEPTVDERTDDEDPIWWRDDVTEANDESAASAETTDEPYQPGVGPEDDLWESEGGAADTDDGETTPDHAITELWIGAIAITIGLVTTDLFAWWSPVVVALMAAVVAIRRWGAIGERSLASLTPPERRYRPTVRGLSLVAATITLCLRPELGVLTGAVRLLTVGVFLAEGARVLAEWRNTSTGWEFESGDTERV